LPQHRLIAAAGLADEAEWKPPNIDINSIPYLLFTAGKYRSAETRDGFAREHAAFYVEYVISVWN
jgi:hypothetical protein